MTDKKLYQVGDKNNIPAHRKSTLRNILKEIEKTYKIRFALNDKLVDNKYVDVQKVVFQELDKTLSELLTPFQLTYKLINGYYVIQPVPAPQTNNRQNPVQWDTPVTHSTNGDSADSFKHQNSDENKKSVADITITGKVSSDADQHPLRGVVIAVKGNSNLMTQSDITGRFTIRVPDANAILVFSHVGFKTQEVPVLGRTSLDVVMEKDVKALDEVIINVPYGKQNKALFTGSAITIAGKEVS
ncbi:MAG TPA: carboxypeptidase-like regulatory domain-containing protein, partial [Parasegetibacter sp.]